MFDKLIESTSERADTRDRRNYFMVSSLVVGALFLTAVVISIYAADYGLGSNNFELSMMLPPPEMAAVEPETPQPRPPAAASQSQSHVPTRQVNMPSVAENTTVPTTASVVQNAPMPRPRGDFTFGPSNSGPVDPGNGRNTGGSTGGGDNGIQTTQVIENTPVPEPPPVIKKPSIQSLGVITGRATYLPKPVYSAAAIAVQAQGKVDVQVMIDESGQVVSATAVSGHPLLRRAAEQAARGARFSPTYLSKVAVKVTGVIVYNFTR